ncbi:3-hydroxyacyl-CoA dehydrogenase NAD-binding domain-containing protein [Chelatococcus asaccharovorans]|uniref:3-hydroxyacyl-CoA dehydrogenase NAD-binding domain-containing protein n=1 Tax=Chelatococcus asaccharovorans TaxID=28210 RepID=UPI00224C6B2F|nr:3-hydroxyacyl-CoA dehydrogenase NAD-binding domain-containing protein [Chelatococcus asaccharovorans]CAH1665790.1 3-hydroxybutyryl-CoA dehydrogenase [Chelatococcus asaccharovorans]CAH1681783.1 3-hydroxybutyryl-CoA dehydrogenase [Chelatococcus asaccharovorans]
MSEDKRVAIIGCGAMGCDVAAIFLANGWSVEATTREESNWERRRERVQASLAQIGAPVAPARFRLHRTAQDIDWSRVTFGLESVPEVFELKRQVFAELDALVPPHVPLATNTSGFRISLIAGDCQTAHRMAGLHFFLPAHLVPAVEVVRGEKTAADVAEQLYAIMAGVGRKPIRVARDVPGFLANRIQHALMREAFAVIDEGLGSAEDVDTAVRYGFGFRYVAAGPMLQKEFAGLDTQLAAARTIYPSLNNGTTPSRTLEQLVAEGRCGIKSGRGFWDWTPDSARAAVQAYETTLMAAADLLDAEVPAAGATASADGSAGHDR